MYAKLINGELVPAPTNYRGIINYNKYPERMVQDGYKQVVYSYMPEDGQNKYDEQTGEVVEEAKKHYESHWAEQDGKIVQVWTEV